MDYLIFTCPECGGHELRRVERAHLHYRERRIMRQNGAYLPGSAELIETEPRGLTGLRCAQCGFPDVQKSTSFEWRSWKDVASNGCLSPDPDYGKEKVACTVCSLDGRFYRAYALLKPGEPMTKEERQQVIRKVLCGRRGFVLCERDKVEEVQ